MIRNAHIPVSVYPDCLGKGLSNGWCRHYSEPLEKHGCVRVNVWLQSKYERARRSCRCGVSGSAQADRSCTVHTVAAAHANSYFNICPSGDNLDDYAWYVMARRRRRRHPFCCRPAWVLQSSRSCVVCLPHCALVLCSVCCLLSSSDIVPSKQYRSANSQNIAVKKYHLHFSFRRTQG